MPIKPGWKEGTRVTFEGKGDELPGRPPQDLVFLIKQLPHPRFQRDGDDLITRVRFPLQPHRQSSLLLRMRFSAFRGVAMTSSPPAPVRPAPLGSSSPHLPSSSAPEHEIVKAWLRPPVLAVAERLRSSAGAKLHRPRPAHGICGKVASSRECSGIDTSMPGRFQAALLACSCMAQL